MNHEEFQTVFNYQVERCSRILFEKAEEYASDEDRLSNFKTAAAMQNTTPEKALAGMMAKHTVSIYDMLSSDAAFPQTQWNEKITDHINYLILLQALLRESDPTGERP